MIPRQLLIASCVLVIAALVLGFYTWRIRGRMVASENAEQTQAPVAPPASGPTERVTLYVADDETGKLHAESVNIPLPSGRQQRAEELLRALITLYLDKSSPHPLSPGSELRSVYLVDPGLAVIDMNSEFADGHRSGVLVEELTVVSLIETLASNSPGISRIKFLVDGKDRETLAGHADLSDIYDVAAVGQILNYQ
jgi:hypothetical protein